MNISQAAYILRKAKKSDRKKAGSMLGKITSEKKKKSVIQNGKLGGRPKLFSNGKERGKNK